MYRGIEDETKIYKDIVLQNTSTQGLHQGVWLGVAKCLNAAPALTLTHVFSNLKKVVATFHNGVGVLPSSMYL